MDLLAALTQLASFALLGISLPVPALRRPAFAVLAAAAAIGCLHGVLGPDERVLVTVHGYAGFEGSNQEVSVVDFPTGTERAPGWQWPLPFAVFAVLWIGALRGLGGRLPQNAWLLPLLLAWTATAAWLGMQYLAAPAEVVQPVGLDRFLFPAGLAAALLAARRAETLPALVFAVSATTFAARLPAALFSKLASDLHWGSTLDISSVREIVNPVTHVQFEPPLAPGSAAQQFWLIWLEHVIVYPALYLLSLAGIAFGAWLFHRHGGGDPSLPADRPKR